MNRRCTHRAATALVAVILIGAASLGYALDREALWQVVNESCVPSQRAAAIPLPCQSVDLERGFAVVGPKQRHFMLVPTVRLAGIESSGLLAANAPNYWEYAWEARDRLNAAAGVELARDEVGLAINSARTRTQDQLHIHIGCIRPDVRAALQINERSVEENWSRLPFGIIGHRYRMMRINGDNLGSANPFQLLANGLQLEADELADFTIVVAGAKFRDGTNGFYVLTERSDTNRGAGGEGLLDYDCSVLLARR